MHPMPRRGHWQVLLAATCLLGCAPAEPRAPEREPCSQTLALLDAVDDHGPAKLAAAERACNGGCPRGCAVAAEIALTGRLEAPDRDLAMALGRVGCDAGDGRACFVQALATVEAPARAHALLERACSLGEEAACAWAVARDEVATAPAPAKGCDHPLVGVWRAAREEPKEVFWEELRLTLAPAHGEALAASLQWERWGGSNTIALPLRCREIEAPEVLDRGYAVWETGQRLRTFTWEAGAAGGALLFDAPLGAGRVDVACGREVGPVEPLRVRGQLAPDGTLQVSFEDESADAPVELRFVRTACGR